MTEQEDDDLIFEVTNPFFKGGVAHPLDTVMRHSTKEIQFKSIQKPLSSMPVVMFFQKDSYLTKMFSDEINDISASGLVEYWIQQEGNSTMKGNSDKNGPNPMSVNELSAAFIICCCGLIISFIGFIAEFFYNRHNNFHHSDCSVISM